MTANHPSVARRTTRTGRARASATAGVLAVTTGLLGVAIPAASADTAPPSGTPATVSADSLATMQVNGVVWSTVVVGSTVYATGSFSKARPAGVAEGGAGEVTAGNVVAFSLTTGNRISSFNHTLNAQGMTVTASPDGSRVYVGGDFTTVDGVQRNRIAAFDTATGALVTSFAPKPYARVGAIAATNSTVYYGGTFTSVGGTARARLAAASASTGALSSWAPTADDGAVKSMVLAPDGSRVIVGGQFTTLNHSAAYGMGSLSTAGGANQPWAANTTIRSAGNNGAIDTLRTDGTLIYGGAFAYGTGASFEGTFGADPATGKIVFLNDCHGDTYDVLSLGQVLYSVGHSHDCSAIGSYPDTSPRVHHRAQAFTNYATGTNTGPDTYGWNYNGKPDSTLLHWYPTIDAGTYTGQSQGAWTMSGNSQYVVLGGEFPKINGAAQAGLSRFAVSSIAPNKVAPQYLAALAPTPTAQGGGKVKVTWPTTWDMDNQRLTYKLLRDGVTIYTGGQVASSFWQSSTQTYNDAGVPAGSHSYLVKAVDPFGNTRSSAAVSVTVT